MIDRYTKSILTVIAVSLMALVMQNFSPMARAQSGESCGTGRNPCYVTSLPKLPVYVQVNPKEPLYVATVPFQPLLVEVKR